MDDSPQDRIKRLMRESAASNVTHISEAARRRGKAARSPTAISVAGNQNVVGNHNQVTINVRPVARPRLQINLQPGREHISELQAFELQQLVTKVVQVSGRPFAHVWGSLRKRFLVPSYRVLRIEQYEDAMQYLRTWVASAEAKAVGPQPRDRKRMLARIHAEGKKRPALLANARDFMEAEFGTRSLADLDDAQLACVIERCGL